MKFHTHFSREIRNEWQEKIGMERVMGKLWEQETEKGKRGQSDREKGKKLTQMRETEDA